VELAGGISHDAVVRATERCAISCEVDSDEIRFQFYNSRDNGLRLDFDWRGFVRFMRVATTMMDRLRALPVGTPVEAMARADNDENADIIAALRMAPDRDAQWSAALGQTAPQSPAAGCPDEVVEQHLSASISALPCVTVHGDCALTFDVIPDEIELRFGDNNIGLDFYLSFLAFANFMKVASNVIKQLRAIPVDERIDFKVYDDDDQGYEPAVCRPSMGSPNLSPATP
jgi:hypothetical protein